MRHLPAAAIALILGLAAIGAGAESAKPVRVGVMTDMAGMTSDLVGPGSDIAARMAAEDFGGKVAGTSCSLYSRPWSGDSYGLAQSIGSAVVKSGGDTWFFITADYAFGYATEAAVGQVVPKSGGKVLCNVKHPTGASDFSSFLVQAQASKAKIVGMANAGSDTILAFKQAAGFGVAQGGQRLVFAAVTRYLKAVRTTDPADGSAVVRAMKSMPITGPVLHNARIRDDGRVIRDYHMFRVKSPAESAVPWDYYKLERTIPGDQLVVPLAESECPMVKKPA